jgi:DNA polymerase-3 subunit chi
VPTECRVDFYVLTASAPSAGHLACRLCLKAWEEGHLVTLLASGEDEARLLDELMWDFPAGRFLPHELGQADGDVPVAILIGSELSTTTRDVVVNLTSEPVPEPGRFRRLLEIVPADNRMREASRIKFRAYRNLGLEPYHHEIQAF